MYCGTCKRCVVVVYWIEMTLLEKKERERKRERLKSGKNHRERERERVCGKRFSTLDSQHNWELNVVASVGNLCVCLYVSFENHWKKRSAILLRLTTAVASAADISSNLKICFSFVFYYFESTNAKLFRPTVGTTTFAYSRGIISSSPSFAFIVSLPLSLSLPLSTCISTTGIQLFF